VNVCPAGLHRGIVVKNPFSNCKTKYNSLIIMGEKSSLIQIKGIRDGLLITLAGADWPDLVAAFIENIESRSAFFKGARVVLDVGPQDLRVADLSKLRDQLSEHSVSLWAVLSESGLTERTAQLDGGALRDDIIASRRGIP